jgi:DNA invertase Pin-like site-specific DNA recombinase
MADRAYIRESKHGPALEDQRKVVRPFVERDDWVYADELPKGKRKHQPVEGDPLPERTLIVRQIHPGSKVIVPSLDRLGTSAGDIRATVDKLLDKGAAVFDVAAGLEINETTPRAVQSDAAMAAEKVLKREHAKMARAAFKLSKVKMGRKPIELPPDLAAAAERDWRDGTVSQADMTKRYGLSSNWFRCRFGAREMKPGRKPKPSK